MSTWERPGVECDIESDVGAGKMAQWLGALSGLPGDLGTVSSTHNYLQFQGDLTPSFGFHGYLNSSEYTHMQMHRKTLNEK